MSRPLLRAGSHGDDVRDLQRMLTAAGYDGGAADGSFGGTTDAAVRSFQSARGLAVDGQVVVSQQGGSGVECSLRP